ncbi:MAG TPA: adenylate/guanylate cyclase domain-containing protein [Stellaceae bacterium]|nr:adenylate/guanylate cyclase domain-containing protein [Stellaceae bacterium]
MAKRRLNFRTVIIPVAIAAVSVGLVTVAVENIRFLKQAERFVRDWETTVLAPAEPQSPDVKIVSITEETLKYFPYREPVDRKFLAELLRKLAAAKPKVIALDVLLDQPTEDAKDDELRETIATLPVPLAVSYVFDYEIVDQKQKEFLDAFVPAQDRMLADIGTDAFDGTARFIVPEKTMPDGTEMPGFARAVLTKIGVKTPAEQVDIAWRGRPNGDQEPFAEFASPFVLAAKPAVLERLFQGKIVLIGADLSLTDRHRTPYASVYGGNRGILPGVVIHAHEIDQLLTGRQPPGLGRMGDLLIALALALVGAMLGISEVRLHWRIVIALLITGAWWAGGAAIFHFEGVMVALVTPSLALGLTLWGSDAITGYEARKQKEYIQKTFSRYVSPKVVTQLAQDPDRLKLGGERREMTFLFTDVAGFTTMSEAVGASELAQILNTYLEGMVEIVQRHDGLVDKFIGDAVFAIFNTPLDQPDHWERAVRCALELDRFADQFRATQNAKDIPFGVTRIGVHSGTATVGNFGSHDKMEYTALGDPVNTASRLEGLNKYFGTRICVSEVTFEHCKDIAFRPMGRVVVKGKTTALGIWEPLTAERDHSDYVARYRHAYQRLEEGAEDALPLFEELFAENPYDGCVEIHLERLRTGQRSPEIAMTEK